MSKSSPHNTRLRKAFWLKIAGFAGLLLAASASDNVLADNVLNAAQVETQAASRQSAKSQIAKRQPESALEIWRRDVAQLRALAENDAVAAHQKARYLQQNLPDDVAIADRVRILNVCARIETYLAQPEQAVAHAQQAFNLAQQHGDRIGQIEADMNVALNAVARGNITEMVIAISHGMTMLHDSDRPELRAEFMFRAAMLYRRQESFEDAVALTMQMMALAKQSQAPIALIYAHQGLAISYEQSNHKAEAREHFKRMQAYARAAHMRRLEAEALIALARLAEGAQATLESESLLREGIALFRAVGSYFNLGHGLFLLAVNQQQQGHTHAALLLLEQTVTTYTQYPNQIGLWWALTERGKQYQLLGRVADARVDAERAYALAQKINHPLYLGESAKRLAAMAAVKGQYAQAYQFSLEADQIAAQAAKNKADARTLVLIRRYEAESKQRQIETLKQRNAQQAFEIQKQGFKQRFLWVTLGGSLVIIAVFVWFLLRLRRMNRALQHTQNNQQAILSAIPDLMFELGLDGRYYNCYAARHPDLLVAPEDVLLGKTMQDMMPESAANICLSALQEAHEKGLSTGKQYALSLPQGLCWFEISVARKQVPPGDAPRFIGLVRNITEHKYLYETLAEREQELRTLAANIPEAIVRYDRAFRRVYFNPAYLKVHADAATSLGKTPLEYWPPIHSPSAELYMDHLRNVIETGEGHALLMVLMDRAGMPIYRIVTLVPEFDEQRHVVGVLTVSHDITEIKRMEAMLRKSEQEFRTLAENSPEMIVRYDRDCRRVYINPAYESYTGIRLEDAWNKTPDEICKPIMSPEAYVQRLNRIMDTGQPDQIFLEWVHPDGEMNSHLMHMVAEYDEIGDVVGVLAIGHNISELKTTERLLKESQGLLRQLAVHNEAAREDERRYLAREIHDELGQYLMALRMGVSAIGLKYRERVPEVQGNVDRAIEVVDATIQVVRNVVASLRPKSLDLGIVDALEWLAQTHQALTGTQCVVEIQDEDIRIDDQRATVIFRMVQESLTNIGKHACASRVNIALARDADDYVIQVKDNGMGFDHTVRKDKSFGLVGMQERAFMLGGKMQIASTLEVGTCVEIRIPVNKIEE